MPLIQTLEDSSCGPKPSGQFEIVTSTPELLELNSAESQLD